MHFGSSDFLICCLGWYRDNVPKFSTSRNLGNFSKISKNREIFGLFSVFGNFDPNGGRFQEKVSSATFQALNTLSKKPKMSSVAFIVSELWHIKVGKKIRNLQILLFFCSFC